MIGRDRESDGWKGAILYRMVRIQMVKEDLF